MQLESEQHNIGDEVLIEGRVVGKSEFENGNVTYCVSIKRGGRIEQIWLRGDEMEVEADD